MAGRLSSCLGRASSAKHQHYSAVVPLEVDLGMKKRKVVVVAAVAGSCSWRLGWDEGKTC